MNSPRGVHMKLKSIKMINKLENSVFILSKINYKIQHCLDTVVNFGLEYDTKVDEIQTLTYTVLEHGMILVVSYIDEYNDHFAIYLRESNPANYSENLQKVIKTIHAEINNLFPDLKKFRNHFLAHNYRVNKKQNIFLNGAIRTYRVPQNILDYMLLTILINRSYDLIKQEFPAAFNNIKKVTNEQSLGIKYVNPTVKTREDLESYLEKFSTDLNGALKQYGFLQSNKSN